MGVLLPVFFAVSCVVVGDTAGKLLVEGGVAPGFVAWSRFGIAALALLPVLRPAGREWRALLGWRLWLRGALIAGGIISILTALRTAPIADVFGAFFVGPIVSYVLSALLLGERVTLPRTLLLLAGFGGVLLVVRPGFSAPEGIGFALLAGCFYGGYLAATRWLAGAWRPGLLLLSQLVAGAVLLAPVGVALVPADWTPRLVMLIAVSAGGSALGNYVLVRVSRKVPGSVVAPLVYTQLISATVAGLAVFGDWPDPIAFLGLTVILASGLGSLALVARGR